MYVCVTLLGLGKAASGFQTLKGNCMLLFGATAIGLDGLHIDCRAIEVLNLIAPPCLLDVACERPLTDAPIFHLAL